MPGELQSVERRLQELSEKVAQLEAQHRAKDEFLAILSHELRTPLTPVLARVTSLLSEPDLSRDIQAALDVVRRNVELQAKLIDDLLDVTTINRGKLSLSAISVDVHALLLQTVQICQLDLGKKKIELRLELDAQYAFVRGDPARLHQVFWNLLKNAIKFTPRGGHITVRTESVGEERLRVALEDTGIGIDPEHLPHVFSAFEQGAREITKRYGGLGLGLAISKGLVEAHGGSITAKSGGRNLGATFAVELACDTGEVQLEAVQPVSAALAPRLRILLVEDHEDTMMTMCLLLSGMNHEVHAAETCEAALRLCQTTQYDVLISDIGLPDGNGLDLLRRLERQRPSKAVAVSGFGMPRDLARSREAGFVAHLTKPVTMQAVQAVLKQIVDGVI
jgi:CheY-like chemotaxis protein